MVKFLVMDVDGTLTDGKIYMGTDGELLKAFDIKDGYAIKNILPQYNIRPIIITARSSQILNNRCKEIGISDFYQGQQNKLQCLEDYLIRYSNEYEKVSLTDVAYIGDDIPDLQCMEPIREAGGIVGCPQNSVKEIKAISSYITPSDGGNGAVRDFVEFLIGNNQIGIHCTDSISQRCIDAINYLSKLDLNNISLGRHDVNDTFYYNVDEYNTSIDENRFFESHRRYIDIQMILAGEEMMQITDISRLQESVPYNEEKDYTLYYSSGINGGTLFRAGSVLILYPKDAHRSISFNGNVSRVKKIVGKLRIDDCDI